MKRTLSLSVGLNIALTITLFTLFYSLREQFTQEIIKRIGHARVAMLGDSHTEYFDCSWALNQPVRRAARGYFTSWQIKNLLLPDAIRHHPRYCFVLCGTNDIQADPHYSLQGLLINYQSIADSLTAHHIRPVFQTVPYQFHNSAFNLKVDSVNVRLRAFCQTQHYDVIDLNRLTSQNHELKEQYKRTETDNVHLNAEGYRRWATMLSDYLATHSQS